MIPHAFQPGTVIKEKQHNGYERTIIRALPGYYVITERAGRKTRISWRNLNRYQIVRPA